VAINTKAHNRCGHPVSRTGARATIIDEFRSARWAGSSRSEANHRKEYAVLENPYPHPLYSLQLFRWGEILPTFPVTPYGAERGKKA